MTNDELSGYEAERSKKLINKREFTMNDKKPENKAGQQKPNDKHNHPNGQCNCCKPACNCDDCGKCCDKK